MSDIAKCPVCGSEPEVRRLIVCGTKVIRCVQCVTEMPPEIWKKYAAAMELAMDFAACNENRGLTPRIVVRAREVFGEAKG